MTKSGAIAWLAAMLAKREFGPHYESYESSHRELAEFCVAHLAPYLRTLETLAEEREEEERLREYMADLLTRTANALKGEPPELTRHSWHDLPEVAQRMVKRNR